MEIDHQPDEILAYHCGLRKDAAFKAVQEKLNHFNIDFYYMEAIRMLQKGQVKYLAKGNVHAQNDFIAQLLGLAA